VKGRGRLDFLANFIETPYGKASDVWANRANQRTQEKTSWVWRLEDDFLHDEHLAFHKLEDMVDAGIQRGIGAIKETANSALGLYSSLESHPDIANIVSPLISITRTTGASRFRFQYTNAEQQSGARDMGYVNDGLMVLGAADGASELYLGLKAMSSGLQFGDMLNGARTFFRGGGESSGITLFRNGVKSAELNKGVTPITEDLVYSMRRKGRTIDIAVKGSDDYRYLKSMGAEGSINTGVPNHILISEDASKSTLLEEFLHGTQAKLGLVDRLSAQGAEVHVKDFMIRHASMLGLDNPADLELLQQLKIEEIDRLNNIQQGDFIR